MLDIDDTIVDTRSAMTEAGTHAAAALWPGQPADHRHMAVRYYDDPGRWFHRYAAGELSIERMRLARLQDVADAFGVALPDDVLDRFLVSYVPAFRRSQRLFDDVPGLLAAADEVGLPVALLTNSTAADTALKLEAVGLDGRFDGLVVTTDTLGFGKPSPQVYLEACRLVGVEPSLAVCIGDSLDWDVLGAMRAGLGAIWLNRTDVPAAAADGALARVRSLDEVSEVLRSRGPRRFGTGAGDR